jgi:hypothetical protein
MPEEAKMNLRGVEKQANVYFNETNNNAIVMHVGRMYYSDGFVMWLVNKIEAIQSTAHKSEYVSQAKQCGTCKDFTQCFEQYELEEEADREACDNYSSA